MSLLVLLLAFGSLTDSEVIYGNRCTDESPASNAECTLTAQRIEGAIAINGILDEPDWQIASIATGFRQFEPTEGAEPSQQTEVRVLYGATALYVGATLYDSEPGKIQQRLGRRDEFNQADWFFVAIDSYFDRKTAYTFGVNAAGVQMDGIQTQRMDRSWDAVWSSDVRVTDEGWVVEIRIPYSMLRFSEADAQQWGVNFRRFIPRFSETSEWVVVPRTDLASGPVSQYGVLDGLNDIQPRRNLQITPYTVSRLRTEEGDPGKVRSTREMDFGGDIKVGLSSNVTLDATINPDFGQVESDPAVLNLTAFETFFPERREFFTEGIQIYRFSLDRGGELLYTRRIGGSDPIIGATKLSGRSSRGLSFGVLGAATGDNFDPTRFYGVVRLKQELGDVSSIGGILTGYNRANTADFSARRSLAGGVDWDLRFSDNTYKFDGQTSFTHVANPNSSDPAQTGYALTAGFDKVRGIWNFSSGLTVISPEYNPNDVGRLRQNNYVNVFGGFSHQVNGGNPFGPFQRATVRLYSGQGWSYDELLDTGFGFFFFSDWQTRGFQEIGLRMESDYLLGGYNIFETRGLGPRAKPKEAEMSFSIGTDSRRTWQLEPGVEVAWKDDGSRSYGLGLEADWNVTDRLRLSAEVGYGWEDGYIAWASNESFVKVGNTWAIGKESGSPSDDAEDYHPIDDQGQLDDVLAPVQPDEQGRYFVPIYGKRDTRAADFTLRSAITLTPTFSIQLYGQLFAARGQYNDFSILQNPESLSSFSAYPKRHDFSLNSFQTNLVFRWEYRPGSTLYVVWSQSRWDNTKIDPFDITTRSPYDIGTSDQLLDTFDIFPKNAFLIKLSYKFLR